MGSPKDQPTIACTRIDRVVAWRKIGLIGPWSGCALTFISGVQEQFLREYA